MGHKRILLNWWKALKSVRNRMSVLFRHRAYRVKPEHAHPTQRVVGSPGQDVLVGEEQRGDSSEVETQFPSTAGPTLDLILGLDFGTSSSKVAIRSPFTANSATFIVPFGRFGHPTNQYLLPTRVFRAVDGAISLENSSSCQAHNDLKIRLIRMTKEMSSCADETVRLDQARAAAYLSLVIKKARSWFLATQGEFYGHPLIRWHLHLGIPSAGYDDEPIRRTFKVVADAAWVLSMEELPPTEARALQILDFLEKGGRASRISSIDVIPEVIAEVVGYARSSRRDPGLHLLVDIGASTVDICSFNLHGHDAEDRYALLTASVEDLGVLWLRQNQNLGVGIEQPEDMVAPILDPALTLRGVQEGFSKKFQQALLKTLISLKRHRDPNSPRWKTALPVFISGGGSQIRAYREMMADVDWCFQNHTSAKGLRLVKLARPETLKNPDITDDSFRMLAVAYGLSHNRFDYGTITGPSLISDISRSQRQNLEKAYVGKEQV